MDRPDGNIVIEYSFDGTKAFKDDIVPNDPPGIDIWDGIVFGKTKLRHTTKEKPRFNYAIELDGDFDHVESEDSGDVDFPGGVAVAAWIKREANADEDAILSKWYGGDEWLLSFWPEGNGRLGFTVRLEANEGDDPCERIEYLIPNDACLGQWVHVAAAYSTLNTRLRLCWHGRFVAEKEIIRPPRTDQTLRSRAGLVPDPHRRRRPRHLVVSVQRVDRSRSGVGLQRALLGLLTALGETITRWKISKFEYRSTKLPHSQIQRLYLSSVPFDVLRRSEGHQGRRPLEDFATTSRRGYS
jgi:hypothetical protein